MVRRTAASRVTNYNDDDNDKDNESASEQSGSDDDYGSAAKKKATPTPKKKGRGRPTKSPRAKISPSKTPASKRKYSHNEYDDDQQVDEDDYDQKKKKRISYAEDSGDESKEEEDEDDEDEYYAAPPKKRASPVKKDNAKRGRGRPAKQDNHDSEDDYVYGKKKAAVAPKNKRSGRPTKHAQGAKSAAKSPSKRPIYREDSEDDQEEESDEEEEDNSEEDEPGRKNAREAFPPVSEMVLDSIKALKDNPKFGSTLGAIKETIALNWPVNMKAYDKRIKNFITKALERGELLQPKGKGFRGRFTIPGMKKVKRKKKKKKAPKSDEDDDDKEELDYNPKKTARDEDREKRPAEIEEKRLELKAAAEKKADEKANRPKRAWPARKESWEVEAVKGVKKVRGETFYLVKFEGWPKQQWEPEKNVEGCQNLIDEYYAALEKKEEELEERRKQWKEGGNYEVLKIMEVKINRKDKKREFLIRWKDHGPLDDTWEPEDQVDCPEMIEKFMAKWERAQYISQKELREAPKRVERIALNQSVRKGGPSKRNSGFRISYEDMDV